MNKNITVICSGQEFKVEEVAGTIYVHKTAAADGAGLKIPEIIASLTSQEASCLARALLTVVGEEPNLEPIERVR